MVVLQLETKDLSSTRGVAVELEKSRRLRGLLNSSPDTDFHPDRRISTSRPETPHGDDSIRKAEPYLSHRVTDCHIGQKESQPRSPSQAWQ